MHPSFRFAPLGLLLSLACASSNDNAGGSGGASSGGETSSGGANATSGGATSTSGGMTATSGGAAQGGAVTSKGGAGGTTSTGGATSKGGSSSGGAVGGSSGASSGGNGGSAGSTGGSAGSTGTGGASSCAGATRNMYPFGCKFAWGAASPGGSLTNFTYLQYMSQWVGSEVKADGSISSCSGCNWLTNQVSKTSLLPAYYAYFIGFYGHANGLPDGNQTTGQSLTTGGAALIKQNRAKIVQMYAYYAKETYKVWPTKPLVWLLEGDYVQYSNMGQSSPLSYAELGQLAADITCAIKSNMPNAVVAIDHSSWNSDEVTNNFWKAMAVADYDMVWTTGVGNNKGFIEPNATATTYNNKTATYKYLNTLTGRTILVDTSAGLSAAGDSWSTASVADLNARIAEGVVAANITGTAPSGLAGNISSRTGLNAIPGCQ